MALQGRTPWTMCLRYGRAVANRWGAADRGPGSLAPHSYPIKDRELFHAIVNHRTTDADIDRVVPEVLAAAKDVIPAYHSRR